MELLIAMTITLLLMVVLTRAFVTVSKNVRSSRVGVELSTRLREISRQLSDDLRRRTVAAGTGIAQDDRGGYLVYYEGPLSNSSGTLLGEPPNETNENTWQDSKFGDFDDYLAFTVEADRDQWFTGKVPRFLLDAKVAENSGVAYRPQDFNGEPLDPVVITSRYAEIIYFVSPDYATIRDPSAPDDHVFVNDGGLHGNPVPSDVDGNLFPDRMRLHRRVLLIRPDLNLDASGGLPQLAFQDRDGRTFEAMVPDAWPVDPTRVGPAIKVRSEDRSVDQTQLAWLIGMATVHQQCDLSLRRVLSASGAPDGTAPSNRPLVAANSLADLSSPHNRFAHVRLPQAAVGLPVPAGTFGYTSMPMLAMGGPHAVLVRAAGADAAPPLTPAPAVAAVTPHLLNGFLRPEFVLGQDLTHTSPTGSVWGRQRLGEDVLADDLIAFDIKLFDQGVRTILSPGDDGAYGVADTDDNADGRTDEAAEAGTINSDDRTITANDPGYFDAAHQVTLNSDENATPRHPQPPTLGSTGGFVDLLYPLQAGGSLRGFGSMRRDIQPSTRAASSMAAPRIRALWDTDFDGYSEANDSDLFSGSISNPYRGPYSEGLYKSGRLLLDGSRRVVLMQTAFDTFSEVYESDGFRQDDHAAVGVPGWGSVWWLNHPVTGLPPVGPRGDFANQVDRGADGVSAIDAGGRAGDALSESETSPPFPVVPRSIQISIRIEQPSAREIRQTSVVEPFAEGE